MTVPPSSGDVLQQRARLFTPGPRLGWVFRDRRQLAAPFPEPAPDLDAMQAAAGQRAAAAEASYRKLRKWLGWPSAALLLLLLLADGCAANLNGTGPPVASDTVALIICAPGIVITFIRWRAWRHAAAVAGRTGDDHQQALQAWRQRDGAWQQAEFARLDAADEWGSAAVPAGTRRADIFGGSLEGWQALLTTHGASLLASQPLLAVDLTGETVCGELLDTARAARVPVAAWLLPSELGSSGLLAGLSAAQFADAFAEAVHTGPDGASRADRAVDTRVLEQLHDVLGATVTLPRLAAAVRAALGHADPASPLSAAEQSAITTRLFPADYRRQIEPNLVRIEAFLTDLARHAGAPGASAGPLRAAYLTSLALEPAARSARGEVLAALAIQWLTVQVTGSGEPAPAVVIAGADEISRPHLERLASACERRGVPLTLLFRHLRESGLSVLGGGAAGFMRLGNHAEAEQAASYIGKHHTFELSQLTANLGGSRTHTLTETEGQSVTDTINIGWNTGWHATTSSGPGGGSQGDTRGQSRSRSRSVSRNWSTARSWADGTNWSNATTSQRVYEYAVEPTVLQHLPDHAILLVTRGSAGPALQSVECDPAIITLPRVSTTPLPDRVAALAQRPAYPPVTSGEGPVGANPDDQLVQPRLPGNAAPAPEPSSRWPGPGYQPGTWPQTPAQPGEPSRHPPSGRQP